MARLVLVHGRSQHDKDSGDLKREWLDALVRGLGKSGLTLPISDEDVRFPYYGDTLKQLVQGMSPDQAAAVVVRGDDSDDDEREFILSVLEDIRQEIDISDADLAAVADKTVAEMGPLNWEWVQTILKAVDRRLPGASSASVALFTRDVYQYLNMAGVRDAIESGVKQAFTRDEPMVVVGHSLGSVVTFNMLRRDGSNENWNVPLYVTVGAPLGVKAVKKALSPVSYPGCVSRWFNAMDESDVVALYPLTPEHFKVSSGAIENKTDVKNHTDNHHGIVGYLDDAEVARRIHVALSAL